MSDPDNESIDTDMPSYRYYVISRRHPYKIMLTPYKATKYRSSGITVVSHEFAGLIVDHEA